MQSNFLFSTKGLIKKINEDQIGIRVFGDKTRISICDGHWGKEASLIAKTACLQIKRFPDDKSKAIKLINKIQKELFNKLGHKNMDPEKDFTPETSLLAIEINSVNQLTILSYGDCRLMITHHGKIIFRLKTVKTWLGAFSFLGLRNRLPVTNATIFKKITCKSNDLIWLFTDGVDECRYEKPTISFIWLAKTGSKNNNVKMIIKKVVEEVERFGAEDNASIAIIKC